MVATETTKETRIRLRREYIALFGDPPPLMMMPGTEGERYAVVERAIATKQPIEIDWPAGIDT